jgi:hypothetical protein
MYERQPSREATAGVGDRAALVGVDYATAELDEQARDLPRLAARTRVAVRAEANRRRGRRSAENQQNGC